MKKLLVFVFGVVFNFLQLKELKAESWSPIVRSAYSEAQLIRRAYLDIIGMPPSPEELDYYITYSDKSYETAVTTVLGSRKLGYENVANFDVLRAHFLSGEYCNAAPSPINVWLQEYIIRYQAGDLFLNLGEAEKRLAEIAVTNVNLNPLDGIDYLMICLTSRRSTLEESNILLKEYRRGKTEAAGMLLVLYKIKTFFDFLNK